MADAATTTSSAATVAAPGTATSAGDKVDVVDTHYEDVASEYGKAWFYEEGTPYQAFLEDRVIEELALGGDDKLVDLGGGTGKFTHRIATKAGLTQPALVVDPTPAMIEIAKGIDGIEAMLGDAHVLIASGKGMQYDKLLIKEAIHHIPLAELNAVMKGVADQLRTGGRCLIVTRCHDSSHYPFFEAAHKVWRKNQDPDSTYAAPMEAAGMRVTVHVHDFPVSMTKSRWCAMIRARFWSTFSEFTPDALEAGIKELEERFEGVETLDFPEKLVFIVGIKE